MCKEEENLEASIYMYMYLVHRGISSSLFGAILQAFHFLASIPVFGRADLLKQELAVVYSPLLSLFVFISCFSSMIIVAHALLCQTSHLHVVPMVL